MIFEKKCLKYDDHHEDSISKLVMMIKLSFLNQQVWKIHIQKLHENMSNSASLHNIRVNPEDKFFCDELMTTSVF